MTCSELVVDDGNTVNKSSTIPARLLSSVSALLHAAAEAAGLSLSQNDNACQHDARVDRSPLVISDRAAARAPRSTSRRHSRGCRLTARDIARDDSVAETSVGVACVDA